MMKIMFLLFTVVVLLGNRYQPSSAVKAKPGDRFSWPQAGPSLEVVKIYRYEYEVDGRVRLEPLVDVQCEVAKPATTIPFRCTAPYPTMTGQHLIRVRAVDTTLPGADAVTGPWGPFFFYVMDARPTPGAPGKIEPVKPKGGQ